MAEIDYDPFSDSVMRDPWPHYAQLRRDAPVFYHERYDTWFLSRFEDIAPRAWEHPSDRAALEALRAVPGFDRVVSLTLGRVNEWTMRKRMLGDAREVTPESHPRLWDIYQGNSKGVLPP